jgi:predicted nucleotide-binding protein (sugar kinase/HSP70/actin superfamily)
VKLVKRQLKVGIPRALSYYTFYPLWREYFERLGLEVIVSNPTNRKILDDGIKITVNDACIPIKVFHGHVLNLAGQVDFLFVPRIVSADGKSTFCPKFLGLPDMVRYAETPLPTLIDVRYKRGGFSGGLFRFFYLIAHSVGVKNPFTVIYAALCAVIKNRQYQKLLQLGLKPAEALQAVFEHGKKKVIVPDSQQSSNSREDKITLALLGYPYAVFDPYISASIYSKLLKLGVDVTTYEQIPLKLMRCFSKVLPQNFFWYYSNQVCWAGLYLLEEKNIVDGIIHITAFGCGPDAMVDKTLELEAKTAGLPFLSLSIDEHTGEGGVQTRLEAFVDLLRVRKSEAKVG